MKTHCSSAGDMVEIDALDLGARLRPADLPHVESLTGVLDDTPPVLVLIDGERLRLLDGFMRVDAARSLGRSAVRVEWVRGDEATAIERAVQVNARHGLPLSARERHEAALRLLNLAPAWSNRRIASAVGVDPKTVGRWRRDEAGRSGEDMRHLSKGERVGRDGRRYRSAEELEARRALVRQLLQDDSELSDREMGRRVGLSAAAVRRVRMEWHPKLPGRRAPRPRVGAVVTRLLRRARRVVSGAAEALGRLFGRR